MSPRLLAKDRQFVHGHGPAAKPTAPPWRHLYGCPGILSHLNGHRGLTGPTWKRFLDWLEMTKDGHHANRSPIAASFMGASGKDRRTTCQ